MRRHGKFEHKRPAGSGVKKLIIFLTGEKQMRDRGFIQTRHYWNELRLFSGQRPEGNTNSHWEYRAMREGGKKGKKKMPVRFCHVVSSASPKE